MAEKKNETETTEVAELSVASVNEYLGIDFSDDANTRRINSLIKVADAWMVGTLGQEYDKTDPRAIELSLMVIGDLYDNRTISQKKEAVYRKLAQDFEMQMRLELRGNAKTI